jgi:serine/threonine protein kinase
MSPKGNTPTKMGGAPRQLTPDEQRLAELLGEQYELLEKLGSGGMGTVYKARNRQLDTFVAVKVVRDTAGDDANAIKRLKNEAQALAALEHPNIVRVMRLQRLDDNQLALVMEYAEGKELASIIEQDKTLTPARCRTLMVQCVQALVVAHRNGIIHRDLKPANILVTKDGDEEKVKILDFGLAKLSEAGSQKLTRTGTVMGSPAYMSPEQARAGELDARSDIYSLGCVFYHALAGNVPFDGDSAFEVLLKHTNDSVPLIECSDKSLGQIIAKCTEKDPSDRFESSEKLLEALLVNGFDYKPTQRATVKPIEKRNVLRFAIPVAIICVAAVLFFFATQKTAVQAPQRDIEAERHQAALLISTLDDYKKTHRMPTPEQIDRITKLEDVVIDMQDLQDLSNAYATFQMLDRAMNLRIRMIAQRKQNHEAQNYEVQKVAMYYLKTRTAKDAQDLLNNELAYEKGRKDPPLIAKAQLDLMGFAYLTRDKRLENAMHNELVKTLKAGPHDAIQAEMRLFMTSDVDEILTEVLRQNPHFAEDLVTGTTSGAKTKEPG